MNIISCSGYDEMSRLAAASVLADLKHNAELLLCATTGQSPLGLYKNLGLEYEKDADTFGKLRILMLDEWYGLGPDHPNAGYAYTLNHVIQPLSISKERFTYFESNAPDPDKECKRMDAFLEEQGPIDLCILGLGKNGHLGFNEPAESLSPHSHVARLSEMTKKHDMISGVDVQLEFGLTLGMADILQSKKIILLLTGALKRKVIEQLLTKEISTLLPASLLWLHPNVLCYLDQKALSG